MEIKDDAGEIKQVKLRTSNYASGNYDEVCIVIADMHFTATISSERDVRLAHRLANAHGVEMIDGRQER